MSRKKCYQRTMREKIEEEDKQLYGEWWKELDLSPQNAEVRIITYQEAKEMITKYEWLGTMPKFPTLSVGLFFDNHLAGVEVFAEGKPGGKITLWTEPAIALARGCCVHWCPKWASSFLISKALKILTDYYNGQPRYVIAYSDWDAGEIGTVYQACSWCYLGHRKYPEWRNPEGKRYDEKHHRNIAMGRDKDWKTKRKINPDIVKEVKQEMLDNGWVVKKTMRGRYATVIGYNSPEKRKLIKLLKEKSKPYPKEHKIESK